MKTNSWKRIHSGKRDPGSRRLSNDDAGIALRAGVMRRVLVLALPSVFLFGCATKAPPELGSNGGSGSDPDAVASGGRNGGGGEVQNADLDVTAVRKVPQELKQSLEAAQTMSSEDLVESYPAPARAELGYEVSEARGLDLIQASSVALDEVEMEKLEENGFVISRRQEFPSYAYGYRAIYADDLPVYVSADSILQAAHRSFDTLLSSVEKASLLPSLTDLLSRMRSQIGGRVEEPELAQDLDVYLTVAVSLLEGSIQPPAANGSVADVEHLFTLALQGQGHEKISLFGSERDEDFSQFLPRGHYTESEELKRYFRAMTWLGRADFRIVETESDGSQVFRRRQFEAAAGLNLLLGPDELDLYQRIDKVLRAFVGEPDNITPDSLTTLLDDLKVESWADLSAVPSDDVVDRLASGNYGAQRIASRILVVGLEKAGGLPLDVSYRLFGQRYTVDSEIFVNTTYDRIPGRSMPNPLDVAFAALGNNSAAPLLGPELENADYRGALSASRTLVDAHESEYWQKSAYTSWLSALRTLSPGEEETVAGISVTPAWQARILSTQLGSWAQLRRDTQLYTKQSYTSWYSCEFPDAYVDPYPEFFDKMGEFAGSLHEALQGLPDNAPAAIQLKSQTASWLDLFGTVNARLAEMAKNELTGNPNSEELLDFINDAVRFNELPNCDGTTLFTDTGGWYFRLFLEPDDAIELDPTVADVHTQPSDEAGNDVGRILEVGTGMPRLMVVTANTCMGPRAYVGLAGSYGESISENWHRMTDEEWAVQIQEEGFPDVPWMSPVLAH
jgi:catechol 2,3-dioxygenase-like lactoylglutathione lyase family enzyme